MAELLTEGTIRIACVDAGTFRPRRIPTPLLQSIR
jgi:acyl-CoA thioester hydrolase